MAKITGLNSLSRKMAELSRFTEDVDGHLGVVEYDAKDPGSIDRAIHRIEAIVDERSAPYPTNNLIQNLAQSMKESYTRALLAKAAEKRAES